MGLVQDSGIYALVMRLEDPRAISVGALARLELREGYYAYVGSAKRGLGARLARHACGEGKRLRWHIDYLLQEARLEEIWVFPLRMGECALAAELESEGADREGLRGFGSSDCRCSGHLLYLGRSKPPPPPQAALVIHEP